MEEETEKFYSRKLTVEGEQQKIAIVTVGGPGSGKTSGIQSTLEFLMKPQTNFVYVNPDDVLADLFDNDPTENATRRNVDPISNELFIKSN